MTQQPATKINNLQIVRAYAAMGVVVFHSHYGPFGLAPLGGSGIHLFFVLSGYIMARICEKSPEFFLRRRLLRIVPPYWFFTLLLFGISLAFPHQLASTRPDTVELFKSLFFVPFFKVTGLVRPLLFVGWTLNYEMFFYLLLALFLWIAPRRAVLLASSTVVGAFLIANAIPGQSHAILVFLRQYFILDFPAGTLVYYFTRKVSQPTARRFRPGWLGVLLAALVLTICMEGVWTHLTPDTRGVSLSLFSVVAVAATVLLSQGGWDVRLPALILLGDASYVLYLVHPFCEIPLRHILQKLPQVSFEPLLTVLVSLSFSILIAVPLHLFGERPLIRVLNKRFGGHRKSAEFGVLQETRGTIQP